MLPGFQDACCLTIAAYHPYRTCPPVTRGKQEVEVQMKRSSHVNDNLLRGDHQRSDVRRT